MLRDHSTNQTKTKKKKIKRHSDNDETSSRDIKEEKNIREIFTSDIKYMLKFYFLFSRLKNRLY